MKLLSRNSTASDCLTYEPFLPIKRDLEVNINANL